MKILRSVLNKIQASPVGNDSPEHGGALFSNDGGETVTEFIYDIGGSRNCGSYSPDINFINNKIAELSNFSYYFVGFVHSHPLGFTSISRGSNRSGFTSSDEHAIKKLLSCMKGTSKLYFPVVQSMYGNPLGFSMRVFCGEKNQRTGEVEIYEERLIIIEDGIQEETLVEIKENLPIEKYTNSTLIICGVGSNFNVIDRLTRAGVSNYILIDASRFTSIDIANCSFYNDIGCYKVDKLAQLILGINPLAKVKIIRKLIDEEVDYEQFKCWLQGIDKGKSLVFYGDEDKNTFRYLKKLCSKHRIALVNIRGLKTSMIETIPVSINYYDYLISSKAQAIQEISYIKKYENEDLSINLIVIDKIKALLSCDRARRTRKVVFNNYKKQMASKPKYEPLYKKEEIEKKKVVVIGCGGSRSYIENLARAGVKNFLIVDKDKYSYSNIQTQMAYSQDLNKYKVDVIAEKLKMINKDVEIDSVHKMLDEKVSDEEFAEWIGKEWIKRTDDVLIAACTDNVVAQERCSRLALKYGFPFLMAGIYPEGRVMEIVFFHPKTSTVCPRCILNNRINANLGSKNIKPASSKGTSIFITEQLNSYKGFISLALLLYKSNTADKRFSEFLDDNKWVTPKRKQKLDRNFLFITMDSRMHEHSKVKAYAMFDKWGQQMGSNYQLGGVFFRRTKPLKGCPDCGGKGVELKLIKEKLLDTREGLYKIRKKEK